MLYPIYKDGAHGGVEGSAILRGCPLCYPGYERRELVGISGLGVAIVGRPSTWSTRPVGL